MIARGINAMRAASFGMHFIPLRSIRMRQSPDCRSHCAHDTQTVTTMSPIPLPSAFRILLAIAAAVAATAPIAGHAQNFVLNGSFETGDLTGWSTSPIDPDQFSIFVHTATSAQAFGVQPGEIVSTDGTHSAWFGHGNRAQGSAIAQTIPGLEHVAEFTLSFDYAAWGVSTSQSLLVDLSYYPGGFGAPREHNVQEIQSIGTRPAGFQHYQVTLHGVPTGQDYVLLFLDTSSVSGAVDGVLDNVAIIAVPEPSTYFILAATSVLAFAGTRRLCGR